MKRSDCKVKYDEDVRRLVYLGSDADDRHWDSQWAELLTPEAVRRSDPFVVEQTRKMLEVGSRVLDAGCGLSHTVWGLRSAGFKSYGVDYAERTVALVNRLAPELDVRVADVRQLPFVDGYFDGVWSLGVIEHFYAGYNSIIDEMSRVLKPGGYAFVTVPTMSPLRRFKAHFGFYEVGTMQEENFYQFVFYKKSVIENFESRGWEYVGGCARGGFKGLKDESGPLYPLFQRIYDLKGRRMRLARGVANRLFAPLSYHTWFYLFRKPIGDS